MHEEVVRLASQRASPKEAFFAFGSNVVLGPFFVSNLFLLKGGDAYDCVTEN
jgi:hypothetical protein